jgi:hypothetical protein
MSSLRLLNRGVYHGQNKKNTSLIINNSHSLLFLFTASLMTRTTTTITSFLCTSSEQHRGQRQQRRISRFHSSSSSAYTDNTTNIDTNANDFIFPAPPTRRKTNARVVITGLGLVTPLGCGVEHNWEQLMQKKHGIKELPEGRIATTTTTTTTKRKDANDNAEDDNNSNDSNSNSDYSSHLGIKVVANVPRMRRKEEDKEENNSKEDNKELNSSSLFDDDRWHFDSNRVAAFVAYSRNAAFQALRSANIVDDDGNSMVVCSPTTTTNDAKKIDPNRFGTSIGVGMGGVSDIADAGRQLYETPKKKLSHQQRVVI